MNVDLTKRKDGKKKTFKSYWLREQYSKLRRLYPIEKISDADLQKFLVEEYDKNKKEYSGRLFNNTNNENIIMSVENYLNNYLNRDLILSGYNCLYETHDDGINIGSLALESILANRKKNKKKMEASEYGSDDYIYYKVIQLTFKVLANSYYGIGISSYPNKVKIIFYNNKL